ncbi:MAG: pyridoxamine 5'-phosphate oxidase family protein [Acidobacteriota bacterium]
MDEETALAILRRATWGVLSTVGPDGLPYGTPLNYALDERLPQKYLLFHAALEGRKLINLAHAPRASFVVVDKARMLPEKFSTDFASVIVEGPVEFVVDAEAKRERLRLLVAALSPEHRQAGEMHIEKHLSNCCVFTLAVDSLSGKSRR